METTGIIDSIWKSGEDEIAEIRIKMIVDEKTSSILKAKKVRLVW